MSSPTIETPSAEASPAAAAAPAAPTSAPAEASAEAAAPAEQTDVAPIQALYAAAKEHGHPEIWGVTLADPETDVPSQIVFQKYLNANDGNLAKAKDQLIQTLTWRAETNPLDLVQQSHAREKFEGLGYVTTYYTGADASSYNPDEPEGREVFTWNLYGKKKDLAATFGDRTEFMNWRVALMELALQDLSLATATKPITADYDPYKILQVHDYKSVSFLRQSSQVKAASKQTIMVFAQNYPELLKEKYFVNVPAIMGFFYTFMKVFVAAKTIKKFHPKSNGGQLAKDVTRSKVADLGSKLPNEYGGKAGKLADVGKEPLLTGVAAAPAEEATTDADAAAAAPVPTPVAETPAAPAPKAAEEAAAPAPTAAAEPVKEIIATETAEPVKDETAA